MTTSVPSTTADAVRYELADGIVTLTIDDPNQRVNTMNTTYVEAFEAAVNRVAEEIAADKESVRGIIIASGKKTFFAGGDLKAFQQVTRADAPALFAEVERVKATLRRLETIGKPVVAAINGTALGGGFEIALATHHRIAAAGRYEIGLPEANLGLLPGGGGITRIVRMFGIQEAIMNFLVKQGPQFSPDKALARGLVDEVVPAEELLPAARAWIEEHADDSAARTQPWDRSDYRLPGGTPSQPKLAMMLPAFPANLRKQVKGADYRAPKAILATAVEGAQVDFDTASRIESRHFVELAVGQQSKNMTKAFFFDLTAINSGNSRPEGVEKRSFSKVAVIGAGMMGAGIAYVSAKAGIDVVLKDVSLEAAEKGKAHAEALVTKGVQRGKVTKEKGEELLARITPTADYADLAGVDIVVEAVFESEELKKSVFAEVEPVVLPDALLGSNTSTLPITRLQEGVQRAQDFIGIHFFSPVDKMQLVEIVVGERTSDEAIAHALDYVQQIRKIPIVVNDSRGFFTSRVIGKYINEGLRMLAEGVNPVALERAAVMAGFPTGVLQISDELNLELMKKIALATKAAVEAEGGTYVAEPADEVVEWMLAQGRGGKLAGAGFYEYDASGARGSLWSGLSDRFPVAEVQPSVRDIQERLTFSMSLDTIRLFEEGVLRTVPDANIGSVFGIGFPPMQGGAIQYVNGYEAADGSLGVSAFAQRANDLAATYGDRFAPPASLVEKAAAGTTFD
ncbi:MAG: 3-hydroxyacyl-CoA dehydrogenase [Thermoleophilia bacterium]|nr:3-hydroxyacyl-CoA dehydrogenase [Thermoleophilia bacterium]